MKWINTKQTLSSLSSSGNKGWKCPFKLVFFFLSFSRASQLSLFFKIFTPRRSHSSEYRIQNGFGTLAPLPMFFGCCSWVSGACVTVFFFLSLLYRVVSSVGVSLFQSCCVHRDSQRCYSIRGLVLLLSRPRRTLTAKKLLCIRLTRIPKPIDFIGPADCAFPSICCWWKIIKVNWIWYCRHIRRSAIAIAVGLCLTSYKMTGHQRPELYQRRSLASLPWTRNDRVDGRFNL